MGKEATPDMSAMRRGWHGICHLQIRASSASYLIEPSQVTLLETALLSALQLYKVGLKVSR